MDRPAQDLALTEFQPTPAGDPVAAAGRSRLRLRVRRLSTLLAVLVTVLLAASMTVFTYHVLQDEAEHITETMKLQASVLAKNLAATGADNLLERDYTAIEQMLLRTIEFPGVVEIQMVDARGKRLGDVARLDGVVTARYGQPALALPAAPQPSMRTLDSQLEVWQPVVLGELLGWVRIAHSLDEITQAEHRVWRKNSLIGAVILAVTIGLLVAILRRPMASIKRYTEFADRIDDTNGGQVEICDRTEELQRLGQALNRASVRLHEQNIAIGEALADLERLAAFPEKSPEVVLAVTAEGELQYLNPHGHQMLAELGLAPHEFTALLPANHPQLLALCMREQTTPRAVEAQYAGRTLLWTFAPIPGRNLVHCYAHEITETKQAEEQAKTAVLEKHAAEAANRAKSTFLANMSHEIRTPLTAIIGFSESLLESGQSMTERVEAINTVIRAARHLLHIINEILDLSKIEAERLEVESVSVPLFPLLDDVRALASLQAESKGVAFGIEPVFPLPLSVTSDPVRLKQILLNLVNNAIKFTERGKVTVRVALLRPQQLLRFEVADTGIGIAPDKLALLFQPFSQADTSTTRRFGGTGLGLYVSRLLAEKLGGTIQATSTPGAGSCFTCTVACGALPAARLVDAAPQKVESGHVPTLAVRSAVSGSVLLVEDNVDNQRLISLYLRNLGAEVAIANNGSDGLAQALAGNFDLVLMDMQMPVMDGLEATRQLRARGFTGPIVALTAGAMQSDIDHAMQAGCTGYLSKPIERTRFLSAVSRHLHTRRVPTSHHTPIVSTLLSEDPGLADLVAQFIERLPGMIEELARRATQSDWATLKAKAHDLKAMGGGYGFAPVSEVAARIEFELAKGTYDTIPALVGELRALQRRIHAGTAPASVRSGTYNA
jgi:signal transduction histidine kinase/DNA-binding NarL/FixJ family response regulator